PDGLDIDSSVPAGLRVLRVYLTRGMLSNSHKLTLGNGSSSAPFTQIGATGLAAPAGFYGAAPVFDPGSGGYSVLYLPEAGARATGFEIPPSRQLQNLTVQQPAGVSLAGGDVTVAGTLSFTSGNLTTGPHVLVLENSGVVTRVSGHVVGAFQ